MMKKRPWVLTLLLAACAGAVASKKSELAGIAPTTPRCEPSSAELAARVYMQAWADPAALLRDLDAAVTRCPDASHHEMRALVALLLGDERRSAADFAHAASDLGSTNADLHLLLAASFDLGRDRARDLENLLDAVASRSKDPFTAPRARYLWAGLVMSRDDLSAARAAVNALGFVPAWRVIGPFDNDEGKGFRATYPPETGLNFGATYPGKLRPVSWRVTDGTGIDGSVRFSDAIAPAEHATVYAATYVESSRAQPASLRLGVQGATQLFLNGALVFAEEHLEGARTENVSVPVQLALGWNEIVVKVSAKHGGRFALRVAGEDGFALAGVRFSTDKQNAPRVTAAAEPSSGRPPFAQGQSGRAALLESWAAQRDGRSEARLPPLVSYVAAAPDNPIALYFAALAHWDKGEAGTAIDLIERGVAKHGESLAELHAQRARFFGLKKQLDRQLESLDAARRLAPGAAGILRSTAAAYAARGWHVDRARVLSAVIDGEQDSASALHELGDAMLDRGYVDAAYRTYQRAAALEPGRNQRQEALLAIEERLGDLGLAERRIRAMQARDPLSPSLPVRQADLLRRAGDPALAVEALERALVLNPDWALPYQRLADLAYEAGDEKQSLAFLEDATKRDPKNVWISDRIAHLRHTRAGGEDDMILDAAALEALVKREVTPEGGAHVLDLLDESVCDIHADGSERCIISEVSRVLDTNGRDMLTHLRLRGGGSNKLLIAAAYSKSGERSEASSVSGDDVRFRQLEEGSTVVLRYEHSAPPGRFLPNHYASQWYFSSPHRHMERSRWVLRLEPGMALRVHARGEIARREEMRNGKRIYEFLAEHQAPIIPEPAMPPLDDVATMVSVSTVPGWDDYVRWERALLADAHRSTPELAALAQKLTAGAKSADEKLDRLYRFTAESIRYQQEYETTIAGVKPHACPVVVERGYGDCKDKALLFIVLARALGIDAHFALIRTATAGKVVEEVPNQQFNHAIVYVPKQTGMAAARFIDPTVDALDVGNLRADDQGTSSLVLDLETGTYRFIDVPYDAPELQLQTHDIKLVIAPDLSAKATDTITVRGSTAAQLRVLGRNKQSAEKVMQAIAGGLFSSATLSSVVWPEKEDMTKPLTLALEIDASRSLREIDGAYRVRLPGVPALAAISRLRTRTYPLVLGPPEIIRFVEQVTLPKGARITHVPRDVALENDCLKIIRKGERKAGGLELVTTIERRCAVVPPERFSELRNLLLSATERLEEDLELRK